MKLIIAATLALPVAAFAQETGDIGQPTHQPVHAAVQIKSNFYGSFTQERDIQIGKAEVFSNLGVHHKAVVSEGRCAITQDPKNPPVDIDDGVAVTIMPTLHTDKGIVVADTEVRASKFIKYNVFNAGTCGHISMATSASSYSTSTIIQPSDKPLLLSGFHQNSPADQRDLDVIVTFSAPH
ncbi:hypothetical protein [Burkholderia gladioli]|uniref:hypothetical protein n=1 Tax=Burkholderia gladioli TaxID=28095 RepID=UPI001640250D|nr:hypothetical protein [Burkholderia gladioli]